MVGLRRTSRVLGVPTFRVVAATALAAVASVLVATMTALAPVPARAESATGSFVVSLQVLTRVRTGLPGGQRPAFVAAPGAAALPCGAEGSTACATAAAAVRDASGTAAPVVVTVLPDGSPTAILDR